VRPAALLAACVATIGAAPAHAITCEEVEKAVLTQPSATVVEIIKTATPEQAAQALACIRGVYYAARINRK
jgi:hypothetical protein